MFFGKNYLKYEHYPNESFKYLCIESRDLFI